MDLPESKSRQDNDRQITVRRNCASAPGSGVGNDRFPSERLSSTFASLDGMIYQYLNRQCARVFEVPLERDVMVFQ